MQDGVATASPTDELHDDLLLTYDKSQHPRNAVRLVYEIYFQDCPIPAASGDLISTVKETQVREPRLALAVSNSSSPYRTRYRRRPSASHRRTLVQRLQQPVSPQHLRCTY